MSGGIYAGEPSANSTAVPIPVAVFPRRQSLAVQTGSEATRTVPDYHLSDYRGSSANGFSSSHRNRQDAL